MIRDGESVVDGEQLVADVCIVGSGPAGLTVAAELLGSGLRVLVVEAGRRQVPVGGESYGSGASVGERYPLERSRARGLGGTANRWDIETPAGGPRVRLRELEELDFEDRPGVRTPGWPFARAALEPYYRRAREIFGLQPAEPQDDAPLGDGVGVRLFSFGRSSVFTTALPSRLDADPDTTVLCDAAIGEVHLDDTGRRVESLTGRTRSGATFTALVGACVIAGGGIENARLLLASRAASARGIGNDHDQVGRWFLEHPHVMSGVAVPDGSALYGRRDAWDLVLKGEHPVQRKYGLAADVQRREGLLDAAYLLDPRTATAVLPLSSTGSGDADALSAVRHVLRTVRQRRRLPGPAGAPWTALRAAPRMAAYAVRQRAALRAAHADRPSRHPLVFTLVAMAEQRPVRDSRVRLGRGLDAFGMPDAELDWRVDPSDAASLHRSHELVAPELSRALGARVTSLVQPDELPGLGVGYHHMGTTRMSVRPEDGVVDADCRVHGVANLFLAGSSVFPTSGSANPTLTVVALAVRLGQLLRRELRRSVSLTSPG